LALGVAIAQQGGGSPLLWGALALLAAGVACRARARHRQLALLALALAAGGLRLAVEVRANARLGALLERPREHLALEVVVVGEPAPVALRARDAAVWTVPVRVERVQRTTRAQPMRASATLRVPGPLPDHLFLYGHRLRVSGVVEAREGPGAMLWPSDYRVTLARPEDATVLAAGAGHPLIAFSLRAREAAARLLPDPPDDPQAGAVLRALTLGLRGELSGETNQIFARTGTLHILSVSGMHVGIIAGLLIFLTRFTPLARPHWGLAVVPALLLFVCATGCKASSVRAWIMAACFGLAPLLWRKPDSRTALALAAVLLLALSPRQLFDLGFQFSFLSMIALIGCGRMIDARLRAWGEPDPFAEPLHPGGPGLGIRLARAGVSFLVLNTAAWAVTAPLTAQAFQLVSPVAVFANLLVVPLSTLAVWTGFCALALGAVVPALGSLSHGLGVWAVQAMLAWAEWTRDLPGAWQHVQPPPGWYHLLFLAGFIWMVVRQRVDRVAGAWLLALAVATLGLARERHHRRDLWVVNQDGVATVIGRTAGSRGLVADPGGRFHATRLTASLRAKGLDHLQVWCAHLDTRRAGALPDLLEGFRVTGVWTGAVGESPLHPELAARGVPLHLAREGTACADLWLEPFPLAGGASLAARFSREGLGVLWLGNVTSTGEARLIEDGGESVAAPILVANSAAGARGLSEAFLAAVRPRLIVVCPPDFPSARQALQPAIDRWQRGGWRVLELENGGELHLDLTSPGLNEFLPAHPVRKD
jgi:ComEC/Rec2-related protein